MAMEKLILRSVMYGVDKIPDSWFDKVPGGFYKAQQKSTEKGQDSHKIDGGEGGKKPRRYSHHQDDRRRTRRDRYEDEYRSGDHRRQDRRGRSSYDSSHDDDFSKDDPRGPRDGNRRRRRHSVDSDRYGVNDVHTRPSDNAYYGDRKHHGGRQPPPSDPYFDERQRPVTSESSRSANPFSPKKAATFSTGFASTADAAEAGAPYPQSRPGSVPAANMPSPQIKPAQAPPPSAERPRTGNLANSYVPYAHIYGQSDNSSQPRFAPPPTASNQASSATPASPYSPQQNPFAQQAPMGTDAGAGTQRTGQPMFAPQPMSARAFTGYENKAPYPESPRPGRFTDRYSPTYASHNRRDSDVQRSRSERRPDSSDNGGRDRYIDPRAPLQGQMKVPPPPPGAQSGEKDTRRDSGHERDRRHRRSNDRGYTSD